MDFFDKLMKWLQEQSTWKGIVAIAAMVGVTITPEMQGQIMAAALTIYGLIAMFWDRDKPE